jgi:hypothetical protein
VARAARLGLLGTEPLSFGDERMMAMNVQGLLGRIHRSNGRKVGGLYEEYSRRKYLEIRPENPCVSYRLMIA